MFLELFAGLHELIPGFRNLNSCLIKHVCPVIHIITCLAVRYAQDLAVHRILRGNLVIFIGFCIRQVCQVLGVLVHAVGFMEHKVRKLRCRGADFHGIKILRFRIELFDVDFHIWIELLEPSFHVQFLKGFGSRHVPGGQGQGTGDVPVCPGGFAGVLTAGVPAAGICTAGILTRVCLILCAVRCLGTVGGAAAARGCQGSRKSHCA